MVGANTCQSLAGFQKWEVMAKKYCVLLARSHFVTIYDRESDSSDPYSASLTQKSQKVAKDRPKNRLYDLVLMGIYSMCTSKD